MEFRLLGSIEVSEDGRARSLGGPKQRAVLAHLVLRANQVVTSDRLIDELWGEGAPPAARSSLRSYVSHLRKALGADRLEGRSGGYVLNAEPAAIDVLRFEALVGNARGVAATDPAAAAATLTDALGLWRGPALDDLSNYASLRPEIFRLEELRVAATEERIGAELDLGRHAELVPELDTLVGAHPLRERLWGHLMAALYRSGRQGDALAAFQRARALLSDELGIDPSPELCRLQEQILRQDGALDVAGEPLRGYRLLEEVGAGAFGSVHRAFQPQVGREVAIKVIPARLANDPEFIRRFEAEAQLVARLEHPHIVPLYDFWREPDGAYLVMRYLRGGSLREALAAGPLGADDAARLVDHIAAALASAHRSGIVHRDVKPANILFDDDNNSYLSDFGIALDLAAAPGRGGTPSPLAYYLSPEEVRGELPTPQTDIYSLGVVLYEALSGRHPFAESPPTEVGDRHLHDPVPPLGALRSDLAGAIDDVIAKATAKDAAARYPDAAALAAAFRDALRAPAPPVRPPRTGAPNPYKGLRPFAEPDAADFFGREALQAELLGCLADAGKAARFLAVVGPSGSGKSSVVRAGLVPALKRGALPGSEGWFVVDMHPGTHPFEELAAALMRIAVDPAPDLVERLEGGELGIGLGAGEVLPDDAELCLLIDQFEEVFTLVDDDDLRARFLDALVAAVTDPLSRVRVVVTLRADFYDRPLSYPGLAELVKARTVSVPPLIPQELERAVSGPAERVGVGVDPSLMAGIVAEVAAQPGALPLLQYALTELFEGRIDGDLTLDAYREIGGVAGALSRRAEDLYARLNHAGREAARQLFLRLVTVGDEGADDTRRRILRAELASVEVDQEAMEGVIDTFGARRLLSFDRDPATRGPTVEVAHEALLREWARLHGWIEGAREDLRTHRRLATSTRDWLHAGRESSFLLGGGRLEQLERWWKSSSLSFTRDEHDFLDASFGERDRRRAEENAREAREQALERRSMTRLRALLAVFAAAALVASGLTVFALGQRGEARRESSRAELEARVAGARELAAAAVANLEVDPERSIVLALEAVERTRSVDGAVLPEAEEALHRAVVASRVVLRVSGLGGFLDWSPDGTMFVTEGPEESGLIDIRNAETGESLRSWQGHKVDVNLVVFSNDSSMLATTGDDGALKIWDPATGEELWAFEGEGTVFGPSFSLDGSLVAASWPDERKVRTFDLSTGRMVQEIGMADVGYTTSFSPDGRRLVIATAQEGAVVVDSRSGERVLSMGDGMPADISVDWSPDGRSIAASANDDPTVRIWDAKTGKPRVTLAGHTGRIVATDWSPDSARLVTGSADGTAKLWEIGDGEARELLTLSAQHLSGGVWGVAFSPDGDRVITGDVQIRAATIWDVSSSGDAEWANLPGGRGGGVAFTPDGRSVVADSGDGSVTAWSPVTGEKHLTVSPQVAPSVVSGTSVWEIEVSPDGELIAAAGDDAARVWDAVTGEELFAHRYEGGIGVGWSPDSALLALGRSDGVRIVDRFGRRVADLEEPGFWVSAARFSPDGRLLAAAHIPHGRDNWSAMHLNIWDWERETVVTRIGTQAWTLAFDPGGDRIAVAGDSGRAEIYDVAGGRKLGHTGETGSVEAIAYSPDGSHLTTVGPDGTVRLWDAESGVLALALRAHTDSIWSVAFSPDGSKLASAGSGGTVRVWALDLDDLISIANHKLTRGLSDEECRQYLHVQACPSD
jgi:WD40 repeat protein/DNA-binding SARP family transcriptional activator